MDNKGIKKMEKHIFWRLINLFLLTFLVSCGNDSTIESIPENPKASSNIVSLEEAKIELGNCSMTLITLMQQEMLVWVKRSYLMLLLLTINL